jgi:hypothetical protein
MTVERLIGPLKVVWVVSLLALFLSGPAWLVVPLIVVVYPVIEIIKRYAAGNDGIEGWAVEKASRGGTSDTWQLRLPNEVTTRRNLPRYIEAASRRGYVATGPSSVSVRTIVTSFVRADGTPA